MSRWPGSYAEAPSWAALEARLPPDHRPVGPDAPVERWWAWEGHRVHLDDYEPTGPSRGTIVLVHGGGGHGRLLSPFAAPLRRAGFRVLAPDLPGFGLTIVPRPARTTLADWSRLVAGLADMEAGPVALVGASVGGTVALHAAMRTAAVRAIAVTTLLDLQDRDVLRAISRRPALVGLLDRLGPCVGGLRWPLAGLAPLDAMSADPAIAALLRDDPLIGRRRVRLGFFVSFVHTAPPVPPSAFERPVLVVHPEADAWTPPALSRPTFEALAGPRDWIGLRGASHLPIEAIEPMSRAVIAWFERHLVGQGDR